MTDQQKPSKALRHALQTAEERTARTGEPWVVVEDRTRGPHVSPYRVKPRAAVQPDEQVIERRHPTASRPPVG